MKSLPVFCLLAGCAATSGTLSAADELTLSATTGEEENLLGGTMTTAAIPASERPDPFRVCDASGGFTDLMDRYDTDGDGRLDAPESDTVHAERGDRGPGEEQMVMAQWALLVTVYDADGDGAIGSSERATLLDDFTVRCSSIQAMLLADFDADGDGTLSDAEMDTARAAMEAEMADHRPPDGGPPDGGPPDGGPPEGGPDGGAMRGAPPVPPPLMDEFDADDDGSLSAAERATLQDTMRARIRDGEPLCGL